MPQISPWMQGDCIVSFRTGVRVYDLGYCTAKCGYDKPEKCPDSSVCRRYQVYVARWRFDGTFEWKWRGAATYNREEAIKVATDTASFEEAYAANDPKLLGFIAAANADGRI